MGSIVCKFGGTSVADAAQIRKIQSILRADPRRRYVVVSAPGKRSKDDKKVTDLLYLCHELASAGLPISEAFHLTRERFLGIAKEPRVRADLERRIPEDEPGSPAKALAYARKNCGNTEALSG